MNFGQIHTQWNSSVGRHWVTMDSWNSSLQIILVNCVKKLFSFLPLFLNETKNTDLEYLQMTIQLYCELCKKYLKVYGV